MSLNEHQKDYCRYLDTLAPEALCWCGWYRKEECWSGCERHGKGLTAADKLAQACSECTAYPMEPGGKIYHRRTCSQHQQ